MTASETRLAHLLRAASTLPQPFRKEALAVRAWELFPGEFGLRGAPHPDSNAVYAILPKLVQRQALDHPAESTYALPSPPSEVPMPRKPAPPPPPPPLPPVPLEPVTLTPYEAARVKTLAASAVFRKSRTGQPLTFRDACELWSANPHEVGAPFLESLRAGDSLLQKARRAALTTLPPDEAKACLALVTLSAMLHHKFAHEIQDRTGPMSNSSAAS